MIPVLIFIVGALIAWGVLYQRAGLAADVRLLPAPGRMVDIGSGRRLHLHSQGTGGPTVVFEAGISASSLSWARVQPAVAQFARTFSYDRAGLAWSDASTLTAALLGIEAFERGLSTIDAGNFMRISAFDAVWSLYSETARLSLDRTPDNRAEAFALTERGRARTVLDLNRLAPVTLAEAQSRLLPGQAVLLIDQSTDSFLTWWITQKTVSVQSSPLAAVDVDRLVERHRRSIDRGVRRDDASALLYDRALGSLDGRLGKIDAMAVIADGAWNRVAWPALWNRATGRDLVQDMAIVVAPSVSLALRTVRGGDMPRDRTLIVSVPLADGASALPGARLEAREISREYDRPRLLEGAAATPDALLEAAASAGIVHVSSHSVDVPAYPQLSHLVLTGDAQGKLFVRDVARRDLSATRLVVLAACATAGRSAARGEGSTGMAWGFLTAGVPQVVATLQEIEDEPARALFTRLHRYIAAGKGVARALQATQIELAARGDSPRTWALVTAMGRL